MPSSSNDHNLALGFIFQSEILFQHQPSSCVGRPRIYSNGLILFLLCVKAFYNISYRCLENFAKVVFELFNIEKTPPTYTVLSRRFNQLKNQLNSELKCRSWFIDYDHIYPYDQKFKTSTRKKGVCKLLLSLDSKTQEITIIKVAKK